MLLNLLFSDDVLKYLIYQDKCKKIKVKLKHNNVSSANMANFCIVAEKIKSLQWIWCRKFKLTFIHCFGSNSNAFHLCRETSAGLSSTPHYPHACHIKGCGWCTGFSVPCNKHTWANEGVILDQETKHFISCSCLISKTRTNLNVVY